MSFEVVWIKDNNTLATYCEQWQQLAIITLDTEFLRETSFFPIAGLIQLYDGKQPYLIDPLTIDDWSALANLLANPRVVKVLHACSEDLELLYQLTLVVIAPVFDTQLASAFLGMGITLGYSTLTNQLLNIDISKQEKRSDWLKRPLSNEQEQYAAADVVYLAGLYECLLKRLPDYKLNWLYQDTLELAKHVASIPDPQTLYQESRQSWRLTSQQLAVLKALYAWREEQARSHNIARGRLLKDASIIAMAKYQPQTLEALSKTPHLHPRIVRLEGEVLLNLIKNAMKLPKEAWPAKLPKPLPKGCGKLAKELKAITYHKASELAICPELLWRRRAIEGLLRSGLAGHYELPDSLQGWRRPILAETLLPILNSRV